MTRTSHPFRMWDAITETASAVRNCLKPEISGPAVSAGRTMAERGIRRMFLVGCGSSNHAAMAVAHAMRDLAGIDADTHDAFEFANYRAGLVSERAGVITFSHSGKTRATVNAAKLARERGAFTICLTDMPDAVIAGHADLVVAVGGGLEPVEPKTRSVINTLVVGYQVAAGYGTAASDPLPGGGRFDEIAQEISRIPALLEGCQGLEDQTRRLARKHAGVKRVFVVGGGPNLMTALEIALKFKEAVLVAGEGMEVEEAFHGPIASLDREVLVIAISVPGPSYARVGHFARAASLMGCPVVSVTSEPHGIDGIETIRVPLSGVRETFSSAVLVYPLYMLAYYSALARGSNPDVFRPGDDAFHAAMAAVPSVSQQE